MAEYLHKSKLTKAAKLTLDADFFYRKDLCVGVCEVDNLASMRQGNKYLLTTGPESEGRTYAVLFHEDFEKKTDHWISVGTFSVRTHYPVIGWSVSTLGLILPVYMFGYTQVAYNYTNGENYQLFGDKGIVYIKDCSSKDELLKKLVLLFGDLSTDQVVDPMYSDMFKRVSFSPRYEVRGFWPDNIHPNDAGLAFMSKVGGLVGAGLRDVSMEPVVLLL